MGKYARVIKRLAKSVDYWTQIAMRRFVLDIDRRMRAENISRASLAQRLETTPAYVTKVMRGDVNFTLETMTKLALAVGGRLHIEVIDRDAHLHAAEWRSVPLGQLCSAVQTETITIEPTGEAQSGYDYRTVWRQAA